MNPGIIRRENLITSRNKSITQVYWVNGLSVSGQGGVFSRASSANYVDSTATVQTTSSNNPRTLHTFTANDSATYTGILLERQATNLVLFSEKKDNAYWVASGITISASAGVAPDGATTAEKLLETAVTASHLLHYSGSVVTVSGSTYVWSSHLKAGGRDWAYLSVNDGGEHNTWFNLTAGVVGSNAAGNTAKIEGPFAGAYWRCSIARTVAQSASVPKIGVATTDAAASYLGDITKGVFAWGSQFERGRYTSYVPTVASPVSRAADSLYFPIDSGCQEITVYIKGIDLGSAAGASTYWHLGDSVDSDAKLQLEADGSGDPKLNHDPGTATSSTDANPTIAYGDLFEFRSHLSAAGEPQQFSSINGGAETNGAAGAAQALAVSWSDGRLYINSKGATDHGLIVLLAIIVAKGNRTLEFMQGL